MKRSYAFIALSTSLFAAQMADAIPITAEFGPLINFEDRPTTPLTVSISVDPRLSNIPTLELSFAGNLDTPEFEHFSIRLDGNSLGTVCNGIATDDIFNINFRGTDRCSSSNDTLVTTFGELDLSNINELFSDGKLLIEFFPSNFLQLSTRFSGAPFFTSERFTLAVVGSLNYEIAEPAPEPEPEPEPDPAPIPAPASLSLLGAALIGLGLIRRRSADDTA